MVVVIASPVGSLMIAKRRRRQADSAASNARRADTDATRARACYSAKLCNRIVPRAAKVVGMLPPRLMLSEDSLAANNRRFSAAFTGAQLSHTPARKLLVLTCMDARIDPLPALGLAVGDAHVLRNAGGRVSDDAIRSIVVSQQLLGTRQGLVIHHTRCGLLDVTNEQLRERLSSL